MKRNSAAFLCFVLLLFISLVPLYAAEDDGEKYVKANIQLFSVRESVDYEVSYKDDMFNGSALEYSHDIAQLSICMALSAFRPTYDVNIDSPDEKLLEFLEGMGFTDLQSDDYDKNPSLYTVATAMGRKEMADAEGENYTLIAIGVCGGGYSNEWLSNLTLGDGKRHKGFESAARSVVNRLFGYIGMHNIKGRVKLWISGFSRAAAVSNIAAADFVDCGVFRQEDIFAYTFATPHTVREPSGNYSNIFNIVGQYDIVPQMPLSGWGYTRYGTTLYTALQETDSDYGERKARADEIYSFFTGQHFWNNVAVNANLHTILGYVYAICPTSQIYVSSVQDRLISMFEDRSPDNLLRNIVFMADDTDLLKDDETRNIAMELLNWLLRLAFDVRTGRGGIAGQWNSESRLAANIAREHNPEVYMAWMFSSDNPDEIFTENTAFTNITLYPDNPGKTDFLLRDNAAGSTVAYVRNSSEVEYETENGTGPYIMTGRDFVRFSLPLDKDYSVVCISPEETQLVAVAVDYDTNLITEDTLKVSVVEVREGGTVVFSNLSDEEDAWDDYGTIDIKKQGVSPGLLGELQGVRLFRLGWRTMVLLGICVPLAVVMLLVWLAFFLSYRAVKRKFPTLNYVIVCLAVILVAVQELFFVVYRIPLPRLLVKAAVCLLSLVLAFRYSRRPGGIHLALLVFGAADCLINISFITGLALFSVSHAILAYNFLHEKKMSHNSVLVWVVSGALVSFFVIVLGRAYGALRFAAAAYAWILLLMTLSARPFSYSRRTAAAMLAIADVLLGIYLIAGKPFVLHFSQIAVYYAGIFVLAYSLHAEHPDSSV